NLAHAHGMYGERTDGNDVERVAAVTAQAVERARRGGGPRLLVFDTYRWRGDFGPAYGKGIWFPPRAGVPGWRARRPIDRLRRGLTLAGELDGPQESMVTAEIRAEIDDAFRAARAAPFPPGSSAAEHVYD